jgi:hypothetical protein
MTRLRVRILEFLCLFLEAASNGVSEAGAHFLEISAMACFSARTCFSLVLPHALASAMRGCFPGNSARTCFSLVLPHALASAMRACFPGNRCTLFFICRNKKTTSLPWGTSTIQESTVMQVSTV